MKKTAVEFLEKSIALLVERCDLQKVFEQAKEMEKEQITLSHINGQSEFDKEKFREYNKDLAQAYYNQTYKSEQ
jgi:hypothetical protein